MVARSLYSHKECENKNTSDLQEMIFQKGQNWNDFPIGSKRGRVIMKVPREESIKNPKTGELLNVTRNHWEVVDPPIFTQERSFLRNLIPIIVRE